jgi:hypothetical protein
MKVTPTHLQAFIEALVVGLVAGAAEDLRERLVRIFFEA